MANSSIRAVALAGIAGLGLTACSPKVEPAPLLELDPAATTQALTEKTQALTQGVAESARFVNDSSLAQDAASRVSCAQTAQTGTAPGPAPSSSGSGAVGGDSASCTADLSLDQPATKLSDWLKAHLFNDAHRSAESTATRLVFCLAPEDVCAQDDSSGSPSPTLDPQCASGLAQVPVCVAVTSAAQGEYDLQLLVGKSPVHEPAQLHLRSDRLALEVGLAEVKASFEAIFAATGKGTPEGFPTTLSGKLGAELLKTGPQAFTARLTILEALALDLFPASDARHTELRAAASTPFALSLDGAQKLLGLDVDLGALDLRLAADLLYGGSSTTCTSTPSGVPDCTTTEEHHTGAFLASLPGLSGSVRLQASTSLETLALTNLGLGDSTLRVRFDAGSGAPAEIFSLDINPTLSPRRFSATLSRDAAGTSLQVAPLLDVLISQDLQALASQFQDIPAWALKATSRARLFGTEPALLVSSSDQGGIQVTSGTLELAASGMLGGMSDVSVSVSAGQCAVDAQGTVGDGDHPFASLAAGTCP